MAPTFGAMLKMSRANENSFGHFLDNLKKLVTFYSNIWSRWLLEIRLRVVLSLMVLGGGL